MPNLALGALFAAKYGDNYFVEQTAGQAPVGKAVVEALTSTLRLDNITRKLERFDTVILTKGMLNCV